MAALPAAIPAGSTLTTPFKRRWRLIPMMSNGREPADDLIRRLRIASSQGAPDENILDRLGHVQPGGAQWRVERHDAVGNQPEDECRRLMTSQIVQNQKHAQGGAGFWAK